VLLKSELLKKPSQVPLEAFTLG